MATTLLAWLTARAADAARSGALTTRHADYPCLTLQRGRAGAPHVRIDAHVLMAHLVLGGNEHQAATAAQQQREAAAAAEEGDDASPTPATSPASASPEEGHDSPPPRLVVCHRDLPGGGGGPDDLEALWWHEHAPADELGPRVAPRGGDEPTRCLSRRCIHPCHLVYLPQSANAHTGRQRTQRRARKRRWPLGDAGWRRRLSFGDGGEEEQEEGRGCSSLGC